MCLFQPSSKPAPYGAAKSGGLSEVTYGAPSGVTTTRRAAAEQSKGRGRSAVTYGAPYGAAKSGGLSEVTTTRRAAALQSKGGDLVEPAGGEETDSEYENSSGSSSNRETSDLDYEPSFEESGHETSSCSSSEGSEEESEGGVDSEYKQSNEYSSICDSLTSSLCHPCFKKTSPMAPSGSYLEESQLSDFYSNSSFYSIDSEDEEKIKKIKLKMRSLKLKIKNIKLSALNKSNLYMLKLNSSTLNN